MIQLRKFFKERRHWDPPRLALALAEVLKDETVKTVVW